MMILFVALTDVAGFLVREDSDATSAEKSVLMRDTSTDTCFDKEHLEHRCSACDSCQSCLASEAGECVWLTSMGEYPREHHLSHKCGDKNDYPISADDPYITYSDSEDEDPISEDPTIPIRLPAYSAHDPFLMSMVVDVSGCALQLQDAEAEEIFSNYSRLE
jgi:hypothetical protein